MALARCESCGRPTKTRWDYPHPHVSIRRLVCGNNLCTRPAHLLWLTDEEERWYVEGQRSFKVPRYPAEVPVA